MIHFMYGALLSKINSFMLQLLKKNRFFPVAKMSNKELYFIGISEYHDIKIYINARGFIQYEVN